MAPALQEAVDAGIPVVTIDRRVDKVPGILAHVGADNVKGGEAQGKLIVKMFPNGATIINLQGQSGASPAIDRNKGLHNVLDKAGGQVQDRLRADRRLRPRQGPGDDRSRRSPAWPTPPDVIVAANDDMALGALEALKARNLIGKVAIIGFDALPEALAQSATAASPPRSSSSRAARARRRVRDAGRLPPDGKKPAEKVTAAHADRHHQGQPRPGRAPRRGEVGIGSRRTAAATLLVIRAQPDESRRAAL